MKLKKNIVNSLKNSDSEWKCDCLYLSFFCYLRLRRGAWKCGVSENSGHQLAAQSPLPCPLSMDTYYLHEHLKWRLLKAHSFPKLTTLYCWYIDYLPETKFYSKNSSNWIWFIIFWTQIYWGMMLVSMKNSNNTFKGSNNSAKQKLSNILSSLIIWL